MRLYISRHQLLWEAKVGRGPPFFLDYADSQEHLVGQSAVHCVFGHHVTR